MISTIFLILIPLIAYWATDIVWVLLLWIFILPIIIFGKLKEHHENQMFVHYYQQVSESNINNFIKVLVGVSLIIAGGCSTVKMVSVDKSKIEAQVLDAFKGLVHSINLR